MSATRLMAHINNAMSPEMANELNRAGHTEVDDAILFNLTIRSDKSRFNIGGFATAENPGMPIGLEFISAAQGMASLRR